MPTNKELEYRFALAFVQGILEGLENFSPVHSPDVYRESLAAARKRIQEVKPIMA